MRVGAWAWSQLRKDEMRVTVTGRGGQLVTALIERGAASDDMTIVPSGRPEIDLENPRDIAGALAATRPDVIVNAAAYTAVDLAESEPERAMAINGRGAGAVALAAHELGLPIIQISTDYIFDGDKPYPYVETDAAAPIGAYGRSKLAGEEAIAAANADHIILRTAWVYAAQGKNFPLTMLRLAATRSEVAVVADQHGCPSYAPDIADVILAIAKRLRAEPDRADLRGIFHIVGRGETNWASFAKEIFRQSALHGGPTATVQPITTEQYPTPARRPANSRLDCTKLFRVYGIAMPSWQDATSRCIRRALKEETHP